MFCHQSDTIDAAAVMAGLSRNQTRISLLKCVSPKWKQTLDRINLHAQLPLSSAIPAFYMDSTTVVNTFKLGLSIADDKWKEISINTSRVHNVVAPSFKFI